MADDVDGAAERTDAFNARALHRVLSVPVATGEPGECRDCGEHSQRLVGGRCAPCRDGR